MKSIMGDGLNKVQGGIQLGREKLVALRDISKLKKEVQALLHEKGLVLNKIALRAHYLYRIGKFKDQEISEMSKEIETLDCQIMTLQREIGALEKIDKEPLCPECGQRINIGDKFCAGCGESFQVNEEKEPFGKCDCCGNPIQNNYNFCVVCGQLLVAREV